MSLAVAVRDIGAMAPKRRVDGSVIDSSTVTRAGGESAGVRVSRLPKCVAATHVPQGQRVDKDYLDATGFRAPLLVASPAQLDLVVPTQDALTLADLEAAIGRDRAVRAIDVASQRELAAEMKLREWMQYFALAPAQRDRVLNLISLECTGTKLETIVKPPKVVREIGWVEKHWTAVGAKTATGRKELALKPKVRLYCLMSAAGSYTESHVDFGGSSVWYHLYKGRKFFSVIPPTDANLDRFAKWESEYQHGKAPFFGDLVPPGECTVIEMRAGDTMMLPSGWIHSVYTPEDSISFGGNFLSGYHMVTHLRCHAKEKRQQIEGRFFFPEFECVVWYAAAHYAKMLSTCPFVLSKWELQGLRVLLEVLKDWLAGNTHGLAGTPDPEILERVKWICKTTMHCEPTAMLEKMTATLQVQPVIESSALDGHSGDDASKTSEETGNSGMRSHQLLVEDTTDAKPHSNKVQVTALEDPRDAISRIATDDSSSSSSSSNESSSDSSDSSSIDSSDGEDTGKESDHEPPAPGDDDNGETNESSSDSSSDDDSSSSSSSDNEEEPQKEPEDDNEQKKEEVEEFDEPEESSSSDSDNDFDPESSYPDMPPIPVDALIAIRKRAKLKELQITKQGKEQVIALARQHIIERQRSARSKKKKNTKSMSNGGGAVPVIASWGEDEHWVVSCSCGLGGQDYDDGREMVECNNCKHWVHIDCVRVPLHEIFWCFKCRASEDWLFVCKCGIQEKNFDDGVRMVQCGVCEAWEHTHCGGVNDLEEPPEVYECTRCRKLRKKARPSSVTQKKGKKNSKSKTGRGLAGAKPKAEVTDIAVNYIPPVPEAPPLPSSVTESSSPPPPPPPPPSAPPSPRSLPDEDYVANATIHSDATPSPVQKRKRGRPPLGKSKGKKKQYDEDYRDGVDDPDSPAGVNGGGSLMMRPPLPITSKSSTTPAKRKSGGSARDRLEKKLKTRKPRG